LAKGKSTQQFSTTTTSKIMATPSPLIQTAQIAGITTSACLSGLIASFSYGTVPAIASAPPEIRVRQWATAYKIGASTAPFIAIGSATCFAYLAFASRNLPGLAHIQVMGWDVARPSVLYGLAAAIIPSIAPYTILVMAPAVNDRLHELAHRAEEGKKGEELGVSERELGGMMRQWSWMNYNRAILVGIGAVLGTVATVVLQ
jgi:hypothetical protein